MSLRISDMRDTVAAYARNGMNATKAAQEMHITRNTIEKRFERIRKETGRDPRHFFDLVALLEKWKNL